MAAPKRKLAFKHNEMVLPVANIVMQKTIPPAFRRSQTYQQIATSWEQVGLIESDVVFPKGPDDYWLLEGACALRSARASKGLKRSFPT